MINIGKKLFDIAFQNPTGFCIVFTDFICKFAKSVNGLMCPLVVSARIRIGNESLIKKGIHNPIDGVVQQSVPDRCFMNISRFWIIDFERLIAAVNIGMIEEVVMK
jgi:hypothetical protein